MRVLIVHGWSTRKNTLRVCFNCTWAGSILLTLGAHAQRGLPSARMRSEGYCSWVCVSVKSHLTYGASVRPKNAVTYLAGNEGQKICGVFSETAPLQRSSTPSVVRLMRSRPFLSLRKMRMRMSSPSISGALAHVYTLQPLRRGFAL